MVSTNNYKITIQDYSVLGGTEHYVIGVERYDLTKNQWIVV